MLKETFAGYNPSNYIGSPIVKAFIISEIFLWSSWFGVLPLFGVFVVTDVAGGTLQTAAWGYSFYLVMRVIFELVSGKFFAKSSEKNKIYASIGGLFVAAIGIFGFAFAEEIAPLFVCFALAGFGIGIASPAKNSLFSSHLDKSKETTEWGIYDAVVFICIALSTALGGFIATEYGFSVFFLVAGFWMLLGTIPYILYLRKS